jgi:hypothetical protein
MQLLLEQNGNFATKCPPSSDNTTADNDDNSNTNNTADDEYNGGDMTDICPEQTAALLNSRFVAQLSILTGPLFGYVSDRYGGFALCCSMGISVTAGLALLLVSAKYPGTAWDSVLYLSFLLLGLGSTCGGLLTVETGVLFRDGGTNKAQSRIISLLNALFDAGAMTFLGLWGLEKVSSSSQQEVDNTNFIVILGGYMGLGVLCLGGYSYLFRKVAKTDDDDINQKGNSNKIGQSHGDNKLSNKGKQDDIGTTERTRVTDNSLHISNHRLSSTVTLPMDQSASEFYGDTGLRQSTNHQSSPNSIYTSERSSSYKNTLNQQISRLAPCEDTETNDDECNRNIDTELVDAELAPVSSVEDAMIAPVDASYIPIFQRIVRDQLRSQAYILLCILFSFHMVSNVWTLTTARDFLKHLGDDDYGNRYLSIFTLMTPVSLLALPFEDVRAVLYKETSIMC